MVSKEASSNFWEGKKAKKIIIITSLLIITLAFAVFLSFYSGPVCNNYGCFQVYMSSCTKATFRNEAPEATWYYSILGSSGDQCVIRVKLLQAKQGSLDISKLQGYYMDCSYPLGVSAEPEADLSKCQGRLKEELQSIIINKLYAYIVNNVGQIDQALRTAI